MFAAIKVHYWYTKEGRRGRCAVVLFDNWDSPLPERIEECPLDLPPPKGPYRDLWALKEGLRGFKVEAAIIDGYAQLTFRKSLGEVLFQETKTPVIGVVQQKDRTGDLCSVPIVRGLSLQPLYVTTAGYDREQAVQGLTRMPGPRIPTILGLADARARGLVE